MSKKTRDFMDMWTRILIATAVLAVGMSVLIGTLGMCIDRLHEVYPPEETKVKPSAIKSNLKHGILWEVNKDGN